MLVSIRTGRTDSRDSISLLYLNILSNIRYDERLCVPRGHFVRSGQALAEALHQKQIAGAGLDVWEDEPPPHDHPLMAFDNVIVSPHVAGSTIEARENMGRIAAEQTLGILDGKKPPRLINPEVWPAYRER